MRFLHISDLHLGKRIGEFRLLDEQAALLDWVVAVAIEQKVDGLLLAGDIYDRSVPPVEAVALFDRFLMELTEAHIPLFAISGNHDSPERIAFGCDLFEKSGVYFSPVYDGHIRTVPLTKGTEQVYIHLLPFLKPIHVRLALQDVPHDAPAEEATLHELSYTDAMAEVLSHLTLPTDGKNILVCHQFLIGSLRSESEEVPLVGTLDAIDASLFDAFDYVALGHLHRAQTVAGNDHIRYSGSLMPYAFSETEEKGCVLYDTADLSTRFLPVPQGLTHTLATIEGTYDSLIRLDYRESCPHKEDYLRIILDEDTPVPDAMAKFNLVYPRVVQLQYKGKGQITTTVEADIPQEEALSPDTVFATFFARQNSTELTAQDLDYICTLLHKEEDLCDH